MNNGNFNNKYNNYNNFYGGQGYSDFDAEYMAKKAEKENLSQRVMIFGILTVSLFLFCRIASIVLGIMGLYYYSKAKKILPEEKGNGQLTAGFVCSVIGLSISALIALIYFFYIFIAFMFGFTLGLGLM